MHSICCYVFQDLSDHLWKEGPLCDFRLSTVDLNLAEKHSNLCKPQELHHFQVSQTSTRPVRRPFWDLLETSFPERAVFSSTFHLEYPSVL